MPLACGKAIYERAQEGKKGSFPVIKTLFHGKEVRVHHYRMEGG